MLVHPASSVALWNVKEDLICISGGNKFSIYVLFDEDQMTMKMQFNLYSIK